MHMVIHQYPCIARRRYLDDNFSKPLNKGVVLKKILSKTILEAYDFLMGFEYSYVIVTS